MTADPAASLLRGPNRQWEAGQNDWESPKELLLQYSSLDALVKREGPN
jgi:hypothetical protein